MKTSQKLQLEKTKIKKQILQVLYGDQGFKVNLQAYLLASIDPTETDPQSLIQAYRDLAGEQQLKVDQLAKQLEFVSTDPQYTNYLSHIKYDILEKIWVPLCCAAVLETSEHWVKTKIPGGSSRTYQPIFPWQEATQYLIATFQNNPSVDYQPLLRSIKHLAQTVKIFLGDSDKDVAETRRIEYIKLLERLKARGDLRTMLHFFNWHFTHIAIGGKDEGYIHLLEQKLKEDRLPKGLVESLRKPVLYSHPLLDQNMDSDSWGATDSTTSEKQDDSEEDYSALDEHLAQEEQQKQQEAYRTASYSIDQLLLNQRFSESRSEKPQKLFDRIKARNALKQARTRQATAGIEAPDSWEKCQNLLGLAGLLAKEWKDETERRFQHEIEAELQTIFKLVADYQHSPVKDFRRAIFDLSQGKANLHATSKVEKQDKLIPCRNLEAVKKFLYNSDGYSGWVRDFLQASTGEALQISKEKLYEFLIQEESLESIGAHERFLTHFPLNPSDDCPKYIKEVLHNYFIDIALLDPNKQLVYSVELISLYRAPTHTKNHQLSIAQKDPETATFNRAKFLDFLNNHYLSELKKQFDTPKKGQEVDYGMLKSVFHYKEYLDLFQISPDRRIYTSSLPFNATEQAFKKAQKENNFEQFLQAFQAFCQQLIESIEKLGVRKSKLEAYRDQIIHDLQVTFKAWRQTCENNTPLLAKVPADGSMHPESSVEIETQMPLKKTECALTASAVSSLERIQTKH